MYVFTGVEIVEGITCEKDRGRLIDDGKLGNRGDPEYGSVFCTVVAVLDDSQVMIGLRNERREYQRFLFACLCAGYYIM